MSYALQISCQLGSRGRVAVSNMLKSSSLPRYVTLQVSEALSPSPLPPFHSLSRKKMLQYKLKKLLKRYIAFVTISVAVNDV